MTVSLIKKHPRLSLIAASAILFFGLLFISRGISMTRDASPLVLTQKVRNLSAREENWQIATTAQPGDVLEYFALLQMPAGKLASLSNISLKADLDNNLSYRADTLESRALGVKNENLFSSGGLSIRELKAGEFVDIKWQARLAANINLTKSKTPLLGSRLSAQSKNFKTRQAETLVSIYSTAQRSPSGTLSSAPFYVPAVLGINPAAGQSDLGAGVLIAGEDLTGIKTIRLSGTGRNLSWRLVSNDLIEAGIPAGLPAGPVAIEFLDNKNNLLKDKLNFTILATAGRATVVRSTPSVVRQGSRRIIVLQGIHLANAKELFLKNRGQVRLENINQINDRVLSAEIPATIKAGEYKLFVGDREQDVKLTVN